MYLIKFLSICMQMFLHDRKIRILVFTVGFTLGSTVYLVLQVRGKQYRELVLSGKISWIILEMI